MYLLDDTAENRKLIGRYVEVWEYPDGRIELRGNGRVLSCRQYDRLAEIDRGTVVEHKRLGHVLQVAQAIQAQRDNRQISKAPSRANRGDSTRTNRNVRQLGKKKQHEFTQVDIDHVIVDLARRRQTVAEHGRRSARDSGTGVSALPVQTPSFDTA